MRYDSLQARDIPVVVPAGHRDGGSADRQLGSLSFQPFLTRSAGTGRLQNVRTILTIVIAAIAGFVVLWLLLLLCLAVLRPEGTTLRDTARIVPDVIRLVSRLSRDPTLSRTMRLRLLLLLGYLAFPIDLVPDFVPVLGYADDAILIGLVLRSVIRRAGPETVRQQWPGTEAGLHTLASLCRIPDLRDPR